MEAAREENAGAEVSRASKTRRGEAIPTEGAAPKRVGLSTLENGIVVHPAAPSAPSTAPAPAHQQPRRAIHAHIYLDPLPEEGAGSEGNPPPGDNPQEQQQQIKDIAGDDYLESAEYAEDVLKYLRNLERRRRPRPSYMLKHRDINPSMRAILVDWLVEVVMEFKLSTETLYLTANILDRFLSLMHVTRNKLQLVGVSAMLVASKVEEPSPPLLDDFVYICDNTYHAEELRLMEFQILRSLKFDVSIASPVSFSSRFIRASAGNEKAGHLANFLCELSLQEYHFLKFLPSEIAASAVVLALHTLDFPHWDASIQHHTGYQLADLMSECIPALYQVFKGCAESNLQSIVEKYSSATFQSVSVTTPKGQLPPLL